jgi:cysteine desulfurase
VLAAGIDRPHVVTQRTEHPAVLATCRALTRLHGVEVTDLPVGGDGLLDPAALAAPSPRGAGASPGLARSPPPGPPE